MKAHTLKLSILPLTAALLTACGGSSGGSAANPVESTTASYTVQITNLTHSQPFAPAAIILHEPGFNSFIDGEAASVGVEQLAEGGSPTIALSEAAAASEHLVSIEGAGVGPSTIGNVETVSIPTAIAANLRLTVMTMLVDTNDAFTAVNAIDVSNLAIGSSMSFDAPTWDSGTEANTETADTMPGPAAQGASGLAEGFNVLRDDLLDQVHFHPGVVTSANSTDASAEGLSTSVLTEADRWDNPAARIVITRTQ